MPNSHVHYNIYPDYITCIYTTRTLVMLKTLVALPRRKLQTESGSILDIAYVTPQLIVCSMPADEGLRSWYRTSATELAQYLEAHHGDNWHIWNLQEAHEIGYADTTFSGKVTHHPIPDHSVPKFSELLEIVDEILEYTRENESNVAVVHCKAGMGRSGTVACAYLQLNHGTTHTEALEKFTQARMRVMFGQGVRISSQLRYLRYVENWIQLGRPEIPDIRIRIKAVVLHDPKYPDIKVEVESVPIEVPKHPAAVHSWDVLTRPNGETPTQVYHPIGPPLVSTGDVSILFSRAKQVGAIPITHSTAHLRFNAFMEGTQDTSPVPSIPSLFSTDSSGNGHLTCNWSQHDGIAGTWFKGTPLFDKVDIYWQVIESLEGSGLRIGEIIEQPEARVPQGMTMFESMESSSLDLPAVPTD